ncbi:MAG: DUF3592 domain-containing protein [Sulfitobacter sp.]|nr:DUF3592 domain-containing protein [Sulfitobacter sp.]
MSYQKRSLASFTWHRQGWVFAILVIAGLGLGAFKVSAYQTASQFAADGVQVIGEVTHMTDYATTRGKSLSGSKTFRMSYTFATPSDPYNNGIQDVSEEFYGAQKDGGPITVWYLPSDPTSNAVDLEKLSSGFWLTLAIAAGVFLAGMIGLNFSVTRARACIKLRETGDALVATVTDHVAEGKKKINGHFQWRDADGLEGRSLTAALADLPPVGSSITVFADPARRLKPVWEGDIGSR